MKILAIVFTINIAAAAAVAPSSNGHKAYNVVDFGAKGDGKTDDSQAFLKAWKKTCSSESGSQVLLVPENYNFLLNPVEFKGPCGSENINFQVEGTLLGSTDIKVYGSKSNWITFKSVNGLTISGGGTFDGQGAAWWKSCKEKSQCAYHGPTALHMQACKQLKISGTKHKNSQRNHISISSCDTVELVGLHIEAPKKSPNTDGIDISKSSNIHIHNSYIGTGDDCVAMNGGCKNINISHVNCGPGHGISVGSLGKHGKEENVENVYVTNCHFTGTENGVRIKTWTGWKGYVKNIRFEGITLDGVENPIIINQEYEDLDYEDSSQVSGITYKHVTGTSAVEKAISLRCGNCEDVLVDHVHISAASSVRKVYAECENAKGKQVAASPVVPCLKE